MWPGNGTRCHFKVLPGVLILVWMPVHCIFVQRQYQCHSGAALECHPPCWQTSAHCIRQTSVPVSLQVLLVVINCVWLVRQPILVCTRNNHQFLSLSAKWYGVLIVCMQVLSWAWQCVVRLHALHVKGSGKSSRELNFFCSWVGRLYP